MRFNKRGQEMSISTLVLIVLAVIVLVVVVLGFTQGWGTLWDKINIFSSSKVNVDEVVQACNLAAGSGQTFSFCQQFRTINFGDSEGKQQVTCTYNKIVEQLSDNINCGDKDAEKVADDYCKNNRDASDMKYNGKKCADRVPPSSG